MQTEVAKIDKQSKELEMIQFQIQKQSIDTENGFNRMDKMAQTQDEMMKMMTMFFSQPQTTSNPAGTHSQENAETHGPAT